MAAMAERSRRSVMRLLHGIVGFSLLALLLLTSDADAQSPAITSFKYNGNGCPKGSAVGEISLDNLVITMKYGIFSATTDAGILGKRRACRFNIAMSYAPGYSFVLETVTLRRYIFLDAKVKAIHKVSYYLTGERGTGSFEGTIVGIYDDNYEISGPIKPMLWSPCNFNRSLNVMAEVRVDNNRNPNWERFPDPYINDVVLVFKLKWKPCT